MDLASQRKELQQFCREEGVGVTGSMRSLGNIWTHVLRRWADRKGKKSNIGTPKSRDHEEHKSFTNSV